MKKKKNKKLPNKHKSIDCYGVTEKKGKICFTTFGKAHPEWIGKW